MINLEIVFSVLVGGVLTLLGTLLANFLQFRSEQRRIKKGEVRERLMEVRRYILTCLELVDLISIPTTLNNDNLFGEDSFRNWLGVIHEHMEKWKNLPVSGSARVLYVEDKEILAGLKQIDSIRIIFYLQYQDIINKRRAIQHELERDELKKIATEVGKRLDKLIDDV